MIRKTEPKARDVRITVDQASAALIAVEGDLANLRERDAAIQAELSAAESETRAAGLEMSRVGFEVHVQAYEDAVARLQRATLIRSNLVEILLPQAEAAVVEARETLDQARRTAVADKADAQAAAVAARMHDLYVQHRDGLLALQAEVMAADAEVRAANQDLPRGRHDILQVEERFRDVAWSPASIVSEEIVDAFVYEETGLPVGRERLADIQAVGDGRYVLTPTDFGASASPRRVVQRRMRKLVHQADRNGVRGARIAKLDIPPLKASAYTPTHRTTLEPLEGGEDD